MSARLAAIWRMEPPAMVGARTRQLIASTVQNGGAATAGTAQQKPRAGPLGELAQSYALNAR